VADTENTQIARICDMREGHKLQLFVEDDGDIIVSVLPVEDRVTFKSVQFCLSGTQSPKTGMALHNLIKAMQEDEKNLPHKA